ncbi:uncharacterized protein LOC127574038 [Pristis pectinata]|uniref:uncharacterized protein LOC127574038 n=1 Tax=Pristis pectinata TaxID=685728 RepID=UPI00223D50F1|nr:uncharacterized protein LOC127574038 [Pristis pectinata]
MNTAPTLKELNSIKHKSTGRTCPAAAVPAPRTRRASIPAPHGARAADHHRDPLLPSGDTAHTPALTYLSGTVPARGRSPRYRPPLPLGPHRPGLPPHPVHRAITERRLGSDAPPRTTSNVRDGHSSRPHSPPPSPARRRLLPGSHKQFRPPGLCTPPLPQARPRPPAPTPGPVPGSRPGPRLHCCCPRPSPRPRAPAPRPAPSPRLHCLLPQPLVSLLPPAVSDTARLPIPAVI